MVMNYRKKNNVKYWKFCIDNNLTRKAHIEYLYTKLSATSLSSYEIVTLGGHKNLNKCI